MTRHNNCPYLWGTALLFIALLAIGIFAATTVHADIAPPEQPPGSNISPGSDTQTQVAMASERVVIEVQPAPNSNLAIGKVTADFNLRNTGPAPETMQVRFPLADPSGMGDRSGTFPEVVGFAASVGGNPLSTTVITTPNPQGDGDPVRWAAFDVTFPPAQDLAINVTYSITSTGYPPSARFAYVLETGAGWNGPIGSADVIVRL